MDDQPILQSNILDLQFGYEPYHGSKPRYGWLLSFNVEKDKNGHLYMILYFVDEFSTNFKATVEYFPSILVEFKDDSEAVEQYLKRKWEGAVHCVEIVEKIDVNEYNHLNKDPKKFIKVRFTSETGLQQCIKALKEVIADNLKSRYRDEVYSGFLQETKELDIKSEILQIHEYDIPYEVQAAIDLGVRCGSWFLVSYNGESYTIQKDANRIAYPDLKIFAFDIETTKPPLKFPNADHDQIMMISIMTEAFGVLIVNRQVVSEDIQDFEYHGKDEMGCMFKISNEASEEALLVRFLEVVHEHQPHIITTYNGSFFDWPFIQKRMAKYGMCLQTSLQFEEVYEYFDCPFIVHLDCYKWVKRDSYLPMNNQGLKDVTRIRLGYFPDEIDPEDMCRFALEAPQQLASYSVSDAVATYFVYLKYVQPHTFSVSTLIPFPPVQILCRGAGTLCETLLIAESTDYRILIPPKKKSSSLKYYEGHIVDNLTYVGGHVESLKAGIYRSDFDHEFSVDSKLVEMIVESLDEALNDYRHLPDYEDKKERFIERLHGCAGTQIGKGTIYHLDVGAMYPNIILTNRLQPISVVDEDICIRCAYNDDRNLCKKKMQWKSRAEYLPPHQNEVLMIKNQLENETFPQWDDRTSERVPYRSLSEGRQSEILVERVTEYSKKIYKRIRKVEEKVQDITICQREVPFYVETVRKFRDQRYTYKSLYKKAAKIYEESPTEENKKTMIVYNSLQTAYKCILNSFYGYVMREGSRWYSLEMAATVCNTGGEIIKLAKEFVERIGIPLELDTDGIWGIFPATFPHRLQIGGECITTLSLLLNYFVCKKFSNVQYQTKSSDGMFEIQEQNSIFFEIDGPYKTMIIPSSTEENKLLKKRYIVFDNTNKIAELKGFELKRRGELNIIKKFQEDVFNHFNDGQNLKECYASLASVSMYWLGIIDQKGGPLDDDTIFHLFSESRNMAKSVDDYANRKSNILSTAKRLSEFLGSEILEEKLKCEFIISRLPPGAPVVDRAIPVMIFRSADKDIYLKKWLQTSARLQLREIIDWSYYRKRFESILQRLIVIPAHLQNIENPIPGVSVPAWARAVEKSEKLAFSRIADIEDLGAKRNLSDMFYSLKRMNVEMPQPSTTAQPSALKQATAGWDTEIVDPVVLSWRKFEFASFVAMNRAEWQNFYLKRLALASTVVRLEHRGDGFLHLWYYNGKQEEILLSYVFYLDVICKDYFKDYEITKMYIPDQNQGVNLVKMQVVAEDLQSTKYQQFFCHFAIKCLYNDKFLDHQALQNTKFVCGEFDCTAVSSFNYHNKPVFVVTTGPETRLISEIKHAGVERRSLHAFMTDCMVGVRTIALSKSDLNVAVITETFSGCHQLLLDLVQTTQLETLENLVKLQVGFNKEIQAKFRCYMDISTYARIPLLNIDERVLDFMLYNEFIENSIVPTFCTEQSPTIVRDEMHRCGYHGAFTVQLEAANSLILSIIEVKAASKDANLYQGHQRKDYQVFRGFLKKLIINALKGNSGTKMLLQVLNRWLKSDSKLIGTTLRDIIEISHQRYVIGLISKLKEFKHNIIAVSKDLFIIGTEKTNSEGCGLFVEYLKRKITALPEYELLNLKVVRVFEKLGFVDQCNYFYIEQKDNFCGFTECSIPVSFLKLYFSDDVIKNEEMFKLTRIVDVASMKMMLRLLSYKRDVHGLASNCYRLMKCHEFDDPVSFEFNVAIFCKKCGFEGFLRKHCIKCYAQIDKEHIEEKAMAYLKYCWRMQAIGDRYCSKCGIGEVRRLKEYCHCGGKFARKNYLDEVERLRSFVASKRFDAEVVKFQAYFATSCTV